MPQGKESLQREIENTDKSIDRLVYELSHKGMIYGLSEDCGRCLTLFPTFAKHPVSPPFDNHEWEKGNENYV
jgi:hypothetical protein